MLVTVRFGDREEEIFNSKCWCICLVDEIRNRCNYPSDVEIELSDHTGLLKNINTADSNFKYANELLSDREKLVLLRVEREESEIMKYVPLLKDVDFVTDAFIATLTRQSGGDKSQNNDSQDNLTLSPGSGAGAGRRRLSAVSRHAGDTGPSNLPGTIPGTGGNSLSTGNQNKSRNRAARTANTKSRNRKNKDT